jgi:hypothetical protein
MEFCLVAFGVGLYTILTGSQQQAMISIELGTVAYKGLQRLLSVGIKGQVGEPGIGCGQGAPRF